MMHDSIHALGVLHDETVVDVQEPIPRRNEAQISEVVAKLSKGRYSTVSSSRWLLIASRYSVA